MQNKEKLQELFTSLCVDKLLLIETQKYSAEDAETTLDQLLGMEREIKRVNLNIAIIQEQMNLCNATNKINVEMTPERYNQICICYPKQ